MIWQSVDDRRTKSQAPRPHVTDVCSGTLLERARKLTLLNQDGGAIFFQVGAGPRGSNLTAVRSLVVDDDLKHRTGDATPDYSALPPSAIVRSSPISNPAKHHAYWFLKEGEPIDAWLAAQQQLARALGTDPAVAERLSLCMRLPGFHHCKPGKPPERCIIESLRPELRYTIAEVLAAYPADVAQDGVADPRHAAIDAALAGVQLDEIQLPGDLDDTAPLEGASLETFQRLVQWLDARAVRFALSPMHPRRIKLAHCPLNREHTDAILVVRSRGGIWAGCFHASCKSNRQIWRDFKNAIGGWAGIERGDHAELATKLLNDLRGVSPESLVFDGALSRYDADSGLWDSIAKERMEQQVQLYSGLPHGPNNRPLKIKWSDIVGTVKAASSRAARTGFFAAAPHGALFANGFLTINKNQIELLPHSPEHRARTSYPFAYEPGADAPRWARYLREVFDGDEDAEDKILILQEFLGACLLGVAPRYQAALFLTGGGSNGKSVTLNVFTSLFPAGAVTAVKPQEMDEDYKRALLANARLNVVSEVPEREILDTGPFKAIVTGEPTVGRQIREAPILFKPRAGHIFACNRLPGTVDFTHGFWRRTLVLAYNRTFDERAATTDRTLDQYIVENERAGVCNWGLVGARRLLAQGFYSSAASCEAARGAWKFQANPVAQFVAEATEECGIEQGALTEHLYQAYKSWCQENGNQPLAKLNFANRLALVAGKGVRVKVNGKMRLRHHLRLDGDFAHFQEN